MRADLRKDVLVRNLIVLVLGILLLNFLFSLLFGSQNFISRYIGLFNLVVQGLSLLLVGALVCGLYILIRENAGQFLSDLLGPGTADRYCPDCGHRLQRSWHCCPFCGKGVNHEPKN